MSLTDQRHFITERPIIIEIHDARISRRPSFSCCFHCCSRFRCSHLVCCQLHCCDDPTDLFFLNSHLKARSKDGGVGLSARDPRKDISEVDKLPSRSDSTSERLATRQAAREFMDTVASMNTRRSEIQQEVRGPSDDAFEVEERDNNPVDSRAAPVSPDENFSALLGSREPDSEQDIQARHFDLFGKAAKLLMDFIRRDVAPENLLARTDFDDPRNLDHRRNSISEQQMNARANFDEFSQTPSLSSSSRRDVGSEELSARNNYHDLAEFLNSRELGFK